MRRISSLTICNKVCTLFAVLLELLNKKSEKWPNPNCPFLRKMCVKVKMKDIEEHVCVKFSFKVSQTCTDILKMLQQAYKKMYKLNAVFQRVQSL